MMRKGLRVDLHTHTGASDGTGTLRDLIAAAEAEGISVVAVTDHDTLESAVEAYAWMNYLFETKDKASVRVIPGIEITSKIDVGGIAQMVHVIGLGIRPFAGPLETLCAEQREARREELLRRLAYVRGRGFCLSPEAEGRILERAFWGKGEICRELVLARDFEDVDTAYKTLWNSYGKAPEIEGAPDAARSIDAIHAAGGIAVLAHPFRDENCRGVLTRGQVAQHLDVLSHCGIDGVEAFYRTCPPNDCFWLKEEAKARGLLVSCGSDHHDSFPHMPRYRLGKCCADGGNHGGCASVLDRIDLGWKD